MNAVDKKLVYNKSVWNDERYALYLSQRQQGVENYKGYYKNMLLTIVKNRENRPKLPFEFLKKNADIALNSYVGSLISLRERLLKQLTSEEIIRYKEEYLTPTSWEKDYVKMDSSASINLLSDVKDAMNQRKENAELPLSQIENMRTDENSANETVVEEVKSKFNYNYIIYPALVFVGYKIFFK
jgi:hypothetical protein